LNDLSTLAVHLRHYDDYLAVRLQILKSQPRMRRNWLALAVAQYLAGRHAAACQTLVYYEDMLRDVPDRDVEFGEVLLFHARVLEEADEYERCLDFLGEKSGQIVDRTSYSVQRGATLHPVSSVCRRVNLSAGSRLMAFDVAQRASCSRSDERNRRFGRGRSSSKRTPNRQSTSRRPYKPRVVTVVCSLPQSETSFEAKGF
jgi:hypothetical protein